MIILDTNVISDPLRQMPHPALAAWLDAQQIETLYLTTISVAEVRFGIALLPPGRRRTILHDRFENTVLPEFAGRVIDFDIEASAAYAGLRADARRQGRAIGHFDALIAGIALSRGFAVATRDTSPFVAANVEVIDPIAGPSPK